MACGLPTMAGLALARLCWDTLIDYGFSARQAAEQHVVTPALEKVVEANTLLSGLGFESGGLAAAHAVHNGLTALPQSHHFMHGEKVNFGTLTQFALEDRPTREYNEFTSFCMSVGLPTTFAGLDLANVTKEELETVAKAATAPGRPSTTCRSRSPRPWWSTRWSPPIPLARLPAGLGPAAGSQRPLMP